MWCFRLDKGVIDAVFVVAFSLLCDDIASMMLLCVCDVVCVMVNKLHVEIDKPLVFQKS